MNLESKKVLSIIGLLLLGGVIAYAVTPKVKAVINDQEQQGSGDGSGDGYYPTNVPDPDAGNDNSGFDFGDLITTDDGTTVTPGADKKCPCPKGYIWQQGNFCAENTIGWVNEDLATMKFENGNVVFSKASQDSGFTGDNGQSLCENTWKGSWSTDKCTIAIPAGYNLRTITNYNQVDGQPQKSFRLICK